MHFLVLFLAAGLDADNKRPLDGPTHDIMLVRVHVRQSGSSCISLLWGPLRDYRPANPHM